MNLFRRKELRDVWADERAMIAAYKAVWDASPVLRRYYGALYHRAMADLPEGPIVELGGGGGFVKQFYPAIITSDILPHPATSLVCDAVRLPFADASVGGFVGIAFFHHCLNPRRLFTEIDRTLRPGGRFVILDPCITPLSRLIYRFGTAEALDLSEPPFEDEFRPGIRPLLEANVARATIVFQRNLDLFTSAFPRLKVVKVESLNLFVHLAAGSFNQKSPFPAWCYPVVESIDALLHPLSRVTGMLFHILLEKQ